MYRKITIVLMIILIAATSSCGLRRDAPPGEAPNPRNQTELQREDMLAKSDQEAVEENINGYNIEDDLRITQTTQDDDRISCIDQEQRAEILNNIGSKPMNTVLEEYDSTLPEAIIDTLQYHQYNISYDYLLITAEDGAKIRENPKPDTNFVAHIETLEKMSLLQRVEGEELEGSNIWYRVAFENGNEVKEGYLHSTEGTPRNFRFDRMQDAINELRQQVAEGELHFISNYKNENGAPPQEGDAAVDEYGYRVYHSAPAYNEANTESEYRYIPDGMLVRILEETEDFYRVNALTFGEDYYIPKQYIDTNVTLSQLNHVIVVDRDQQNQASFEVGEDGLNLVSYTLSTTGTPGNFSFETTLGSYKAIVKRDRFQYLESGTQNIAGYAPFAIRFTGGAYIHGVPVAYEEEDGQQVDPGLIEYLHTIGTFPRSNMCVRNFTSHAEFLYNWIDIENGAVIVIE
ncbi:L,D-transpeptidase [Alkaliphilus peptidifermentans]|uniref:Lipoprotein-anchoring transpeptidase ErfK/SrfK n=1 Tax=Alkaliphilus peptidifermentans DSM 18978 TaxID=1120976 RepID=A0A1G5L0D5_9FIRM|nr:L,D-transpeptidase [Alkaliphilus peptidifermentans]SCZ06317.1 Lipoprotein-anchoring transpeptidase ErfK/SrfK [Alkaliphilus peptidifermentans DSM 18978]